MYFQEQVQDVPADTVVVDPQVADTLTQVVDSTSADSANAIVKLNQGLEEAGQLLYEGEVDLFFRKLYEGLGSLVVEMIPRLFSAFFVLLLFYVLYRALGSVLRRVMRSSTRVEKSLEALVLKTYRIAALSFIAVMVLAQLGVNVAALLAGLGIAGIAVGFAAKDTLENFISGITILLDKPFRVGDNVQIEDVFGTIVEITLRSTRLRTLDHQMMVMPNIHMINQKLINHTMLPTLRVAIPFGIAYKEFPQQARDVVLQLVEGDPRVHPRFAPEVVVTGLNDSSVDMALWIYLKDPKLEVPIRLEYIEKIREALRKADIEIPFPHLQLFLDEAKGLEGTALLPEPTPPDKDTTTDWKESDTGHQKPD